MKWKVELTGNGKTLERLSLVFNDEISIFKENETYLLEAKHFNSIDESEIIITEVENLLSKINSLAKICLNILEDIDYNCIYYFNEKGNKQTILKPLSVTLTIRCDTETKNILSDGTIEVYNPAVKIKDWIGVACKDDCVGKVLDLISYDFNSWAGLYNIIDVLRKDEKYFLTLKGKDHFKSVKNIKLIRIKPPKRNQGMTTMIQTHLKNLLNLSMHKV
jgi:hypothetical protein